MRSICKKYVHLLKTYPGTTKILSGAFLVCLGDFLAQKLVEKRHFSSDISDKSAYNFRRSIRFGFVALIWITPNTRIWVDLILPRLVKRENSKSKTTFALKKVALDAFVFAPYIGSCVYLLNGWMERYDEKDLKLRQQQILDAKTNPDNHHNFSHLWRQGQDVIPTLIYYSWHFWPIAQFINFRYVPLTFQASFIQLSALFWNTFLSYVLHKTLEDGKSEGQTGASGMSTQPENKILEITADSKSENGKK